MRLRPGDPDEMVVGIRCVAREQAEHRSRPHDAGGDADVAVRINPTLVALHDHGEPCNEGSRSGPDRGAGNRPFRPLPRPPFDRLSLRTGVRLGPRLPDSVSPSAVT